VDKFLDTYEQPKLSQKDISHLNRYIISSESKAVIVFPKRKVQDLMNSLLNRIPKARENEQICNIKILYFTI
jgi:hypothetical protein